MANGVFNIAKGKAAYYASQAGVGNAALILVLLRVVQVDDTLNNHDDLAALLAAANTEANFTNYARKTITATTITVDDGANNVEADFGDQTWTAAGGATNNTLVKAIVCYDPDTTGGTDSALIPLTYQDFVVTTDGNDLVAQVHADGFFGAS